MPEGKAQKTYERKRRGFIESLPAAYSGNVRMGLGLLVAPLVIGVKPGQRRDGGRGPDYFPFVFVLKGFRGGGFAGSARS